MYTLYGLVPFLLQKGKKKVYRICNESLNYVCFFKDTHAECGEGGTNSQQKKTKIYSLVKKKKQKRCGSWKMTIVSKLYYAAHFACTVPIYTRAYHIEQYRV